MISPLRWLSPLAVACLLSPLSCQQKPASYPDKAGVEAARTKWCAMINKHRTEGSASIQADCEGFYPAASAPFMEKMVGCYDKLLTEYGDDAPDSFTLIETCKQEVLGNVDPGDVSQTPAVKARCERMQRCQQVSVAACNKSFAEVNGMSRAMLSSMYNLRAQAQVAECFNDKACSDEEETVQEGCYQPVIDKLLWLPINLGQDPGLAPDPS